MSASRRDCCGVISQSLYQKIDSVDSPGETKLLIKMRGGFIIDGSRLMPNENAFLAPSVIASILREDRGILYLIHDKDKESFLILFPEFEGYPI